MSFGRKDPQIRLVAKISWDELILKLISSVDDIDHADYRRADANQLRHIADHIEYVVEKRERNASDAV